MTIASALETAMMVWVDNKGIHGFYSFCTRNCDYGLGQMPCIWLLGPFGLGLDPSAFAGPRVAMVGSGKP